MAIPNLGWGGANVAGVYNSVSGAIKEYVPKKASFLFNTQSKIIASGALKKQKVDGADWTTVVVPPCASDVGWGRDFARWPVGETPNHAKMRVPPTHILGVLRLGIAASMARMSTQEAAKLVETHLSARLKQMAMHLARGVFGGAMSPVTANLGTWSSTAADGTVTMDFMDVSLFKPGAGYDYLPNGGAAYVVRCLTVTRQSVTSGTTNSGNVAGRVTFINDVKNPATGAVVVLAATTTSISDVFRQRGSTAGFGGTQTLTGDVITSYDDMAGVASLQGFSASTLPGWNGNLLAVGGTYNQEVASAFAGLIEAASGEAPTHYFTSPALVRAHGASFQVIGSSFGFSAGNSAGATPRSIGANGDKYGDNTTYTLNGRPLIADISCPATTIIAHNDDHVWLAEFSEIQALEQSGDGRLLDRDFVSTSWQLDGQYQLVTDMRQAVGEMTGFTGL